MSYTFSALNEGGFGGYALSDQVLYNLKWFIEWSMLNAGAYHVVQLGDDEAQLQTVNDERYTQGTVWNGAGREWVWESGINASSGYVSPFRVSGIYVNDNFHSIDELGTFQYHVDYQHGRIVFDSPQNPDDIIKVEYCWKTAQCDFADHPHFRKLMQDALDRFLDETAPSTDPVKEHQIWLPAIFLQERSGTSRGLQLGGGQIKTRIITCHIFAEEPWMRNLLADWLDNQNRKAFVMADLNNVIFPFDQYGDIVDTATNWPSMSQAYPWRKLRITSGNMSRLESLNPSIFRAQVDWEIEIDIGNA